MSFLDDEAESLKEDVLPYAVRFGKPDADVHEILELALKASESGDKDSSLQLLHLSLRLGKAYGGFLFPIDRQVKDVIILRPEDARNISFSRPLKEKTFLVIIVYENPNDGLLYPLIWRAMYITRSKRWFFTPLPFEEYNEVLQHVKVKGKSGKGKHAASVEKELQNTVIPKEESEK